ncbi:efflux RND transporter periplasmic adaptor subunit [Nonomuraea sp. NPDC000554]|uniref:efflux RND transporter periplasmic adaptor subunit n=1 Tax=Nonomuraea sp. NPDC000554 TaxID=3154259 RepID=UPI003321925E
MRPTFRARTLGGLALAVLVAGSGLVFALRDDAPPGVQVRLAAAKRGAVTASVTAAGSTVDGSRRDLAFASSGTVTKVYVKVGAKVAKGQVLARIDSRAAREAHAAAEADLAAAREALESASSSTATCPPTAATGAGGGGFGPSEAPSASVSPTPSPTHPPTSGPAEPPGQEPQPTVTVTVTETATMTATVNATVTETVTATPSGAPTSGAKPSSTAKPTGRPTGKPTGKPTATPSGRPTATGRPTGGPSARPSRQPTGGPRPSQSAGGCGRGGLSEEQAAADVDRAEAAVEQAADAVRGTRIVAPAAGTVLSLAGAAGDSAATGTFVSLGDLNELQVQAMVTESDVSRLKLGQRAQITLAARNGERHTGRVTGIAPTATVDGQLVRYSVTLAFDDPPKGLMLGQTASVSVSTATAADAVYVPAEAVRSRADGTSVVTVRSGGRDAARVVRTGVRGDQYVEVTSGLEESDQVVMAGADTGEFPDGSWPGTSSEPSATSQPTFSHG